MIKAIIWDMDGVIIDSETHYQRLEKEFLGRLGIFADTAVLASYMGTPFSQYFPILAEKYGSNKSLDEAAVEYQSFIEELYKDHVELMPGIEEVFPELSSLYKFGLATSTTKELADQVLLKFDLLKYFSERTHGDEIKNGKPDPEIFNLSMKKLNIGKDEAVIIEDSENGMKAGRASGAKVIGYKGIHNKNLDFSGADFVIQDLKEIHKIVETLR
jgi:HAD superfamily hydrolase (TIGR01509 family)